MTRATRASVTLNTLETLDYGIVFTSGARGTCQGNTFTGVATPTMGAVVRALTAFPGVQSGAAEEAIASPR